MSKITNDAYDGLTRSGTGCFKLYPYTYGNNSGRQRRQRVKTASSTVAEKAECGCSLSTCAIYRSRCAVDDRSFAPLLTDCTNGLALTTDNAALSIHSAALSVVSAALSIGKNCADLQNTIYTVQQYWNKF